jgi:hypothetical protein
MAAAAAEQSVAERGAETAKAQLLAAMMRDPGDVAGAK